jgi:hypothetical protein
MCSAAARGACGARWTGSESGRRPSPPAAPRTPGCPSTARATVPSRRRSSAPWGALVAVEAGDGDAQVRPVVLLPVHEPRPAARAAGADAIGRRVVFGEQLAAPQEPKRRAVRQGEAREGSAVGLAAARAVAVEDEPGYFVDLELDAAAEAGTMHCVNPQSAGSCCGTSARRSASGHPSRLLKTAHPVRFSSHESGTCPDSLATNQSLTRLLRRRGHPWPR